LNAEYVLMSAMLGLRMTEQHTAATLLQLRRIGIDLTSMSDALVGTGLRASEVPAWLRQIPDGTGERELIRRLDQRARDVRPEQIDVRWRRVPPTRHEPRERWWPTQELLDAGTDLLLEEWDPFGIRLAGVDRETVAVFTFHFFGPLLAPNGVFDPITHVAEMIASAESDHLALRPSPESHRHYLAQRLRVLVDRYPRSRLQPRGSISDIAPLPVDPDGVCSCCNASGIIVRITTATIPPRSSRYCQSCWSALEPR
jgi:hypothetical protein